MYAIFLKISGFKDFEYDMNMDVVDMDMVDIDTADMDMWLLIFSSIIDKNVNFGLIIKWLKYQLILIEISMLIKM